MALGRRWLRATTAGPFNKEHGTVQKILSVLIGIYAAWS
jgi:hypothetical protein